MKPEDLDEIEKEAKNGYDQEHVFTLCTALRKAWVTLSVAQEALVWSKEMFVARDEMNAKVHCAPVRLSPITERVKMALAKIEELEKVQS